ncbi:MAG: alpha-amylase family glycosyl hydrolase [Lachnospiraceae bacterium]|nr:alpha-amylase family glycosyl hydrolase [Lachnospiraceae bacterium]
MKYKRITERTIIASILATAIFFAGCGAKGEEETLDVTSLDNAVSADVRSDITGRYILSDTTGEAVIDDVNFDYYKELTKEDNNRVFYEIFVGSFSDSDGDGIGDLRGIINRFDYLNDGDPQSGESLGVEGIWLSPIFESPSYHKYDVTDYYKIDEKFGTMEDLKELAGLCEQRNVKLILDLVINHTGSKNEWFKEFCSARRRGETDNKYYDFYSYNDTIKDGNKTFYKIPSGDGCYEGNFSSEMPELNYDNKEVREAVLDVAKYYLNDIGVDGFRFDAAKYVYFGETERNVEFWTWYMEELKKINPDIYCVAEVWDSDSMTVEYAPCINCFDFTMAATDGLISSTTKHGDVNKYTGYVEQYINLVSDKNEDATIIPFIANHDMDRAAGYMTVASGYAKVSANLYILGPGSPFIYYGEEIGIKGSRGGANTDANRRTAMLWGDGDTVKDPEGTTFEPEKQTNGDVNGLKKDGDSLLNYYKRLIMIRKANPEIALGDYEAILLPDTRVGGFKSVYEGKTVYVFHNTSGGTQKVDLGGYIGNPEIGITDIIGVREYELGGESEYVGATLEGNVLTLYGQTSVVIR